MTTASCEVALAYLKSVKPNDGWQVKKSFNKGFRLLRRNLPVSESYFLDIHLLENKVVAGIISHGSTSSQAQELVDSRGRPMRKGKVVSVKTYKGKQKTPTPSRATSDSSTTEPLSDAQNKMILKYGGLGLLSIMFLQLLKQAMFGLYILATPMLYIYLVSKCPKQETFDARKEVKRVMRGHHLAEDDPNKPKGFFSETLARMTASVTTEAAIAAMGAEVTMVPLAGAAIVATVRVPAAQMDYYWIGIHENWYYVYSSELKE